ncbi:sensor histidine kinase [Turicibacter sanguinis]|uniref:HAMP domain-containing sensor histidine kinase n=1 Tax=Turicibacter sanguinis TaxID=154288 RepID=UPI00232E6FD9|nr:sensor histidine kinase [Turicibacter sanguinis]MDB8543078.1 sensor histidine kinase [Turicibacter sanguinis]
MDTNSKSSNKISKWIVGIISVLIIGMISGWLYSQYENMGKIAKQQSGTIYTDHEFYTYLSELSYTLYFDTLKQENKEISNEELIQITTNDLEYLYDRYYHETSIENVDFYYLSTDEQYKVLMKSIGSYVKNNLIDSNWIFDQLQNMEYLVIYQTEGSNYKYGNLNLETLNNANLTASQLENLKNQYQSFVVLNYDANGNLTVINNYEFDSSTNVYNHFEYQDGYKLAPIKNMTIVYGVPKILTYTDYIWQMNYRYDWWSIQSVVGYFSWIAIALTAITAIILPINAFKQSKLFTWILKIPFEIMLFLSIFLFPIFIEAIPSLVQSTLEEMEFMNTSYLIFPESVHHLIAPTFNIVMWTIVLYWFFLDCVYLKNLFKIGWKATIKTKFISINLMRGFVRKGRLIYQNLANIDLKNANTKKLALFLGIQFVMISIMCLTWVFGLFIAIIYTGFLFVYLNKKIKKIESDYSRLFEVTNEVAEGNLDVVIDEDLGIFNSFKDEVVNIQSGLKKAVQNEVKSQRMKTDLIANVSHDLKTPLTSIITYVDLLKDENLTHEKRTQYLETLDQKSQRLKILIEDLFEMSKASSGNITMNLQMVDVVSLMKQTLLETEDKIEEAGLMIRRQFPEHKVMISLDSERTFRVFENLISNMTKYAMARTRAYIDIVDDEEIVQIIFKNMSAEEINVNVDELVERFVRGDQSRHTEGSGLGLAIAKSFVELQGGQFVVQVDGDLFKVIITFSK